MWGSRSSPFLRTIYAPLWCWCGWHKLRVPCICLLIAGGLLIRDLSHSRLSRHEMHWHHKHHSIFVNTRTHASETLCRNSTEWSRWMCRAPFHLHDLSASLHPYIFRSAHALWYTLTHKSKRVQDSTAKALNEIWTENRKYSSPFILTVQLWQSSTQPTRYDKMFAFCESKA